MRRWSGRSGVSLIELIIAVGLSAALLAALAILTGTAARHQVYALRSASAQLNASLAFKAIESELSEATYLWTPSAGASGAILEACANAQPAPDGGAFVRIDAAQPMRFFAFCQAGGIVYRHSLGGCPAAYLCGSSPAGAFGSSAHPVSATFMRPSDGGIVQVALTAVSNGITAARGSSFKIEIAEGMNP